VARPLPPSSYPTAAQGHNPSFAGNRTERPVKFGRRRLVERSAPGPGRSPKADPRLGVVLYDDVERLDAAGTIGVVSMAARVLPAIKGITIAHAAVPVALASGLTVVARHGFADAPPCDVTIVCGGPAVERRSGMEPCSPSCAASPASYRLGLHRRVHPRRRGPARRP
jgi:hypothetical protein